MFIYKIQTEYKASLWVNRNIGLGFIKNNKIIKKVNAIIKDFSLSIVL